MRVPHDQFAKGILEVALENRGRVLTELQLRAEPLRLDVGFVPICPCQDARDLGWLGQMAKARCVFEAEHNTPTTATVLACIRRQLIWWQVLTTEARPGATVPVPVLWVLSSGRSERALHDLGCAPKPGWPRGVYAAPVGTRVHLVVLSELPRERATLLLRLLGRGRTLRAALEDLRALPADAWERRGVLRLVTTLQIEAPRESGRSSQEDDVGKYMEMIEAHERKLRAEGAALSLVRLFERKLGRSLTANDHTALRQKFDAVGPERLGDVVLDLPGDALARWLADPDAR